MTTSYPLLPEDSDFYLKFLDGEILSTHTISFLPNNALIEFSDLIKDKLNAQNYQSCLIFNSLDEQSQLKKDSFLDKIMTAVKIDLDSCLIINLNNKFRINFSELHKTNLLPEKIILFGTDALHLNLNMMLSENKINNLLNYQFIKSKSLHELEQDSAAKKTFWIHLQTVFLK